MLFLNVLASDLLGLLALLLSFSFAMAESRFDVRKQVVIDEANAIGTAGLRTRVVPDPRGSEIREVLRDYVAVRLALYRAGGATAQEELKTSARVATEAWSRAAQIARQNPRSVPAGLLLQSLNEVIDLNTKRVAVSNNHVPIAVLLALLAVAIVAMGWVGLGLALSNRRSFATTIILSSLIALVAAVIVDLDQPWRGLILIRVSQDLLVDVQRMLANQP